MITMLAQTGRNTEYIGGGGGGVFLVLLVLVFVVCVVMVDAWTRDRPVILWGLVVLLTGPLGLLFYLALVVYD